MCIHGRSLFEGLREALILGLRGLLGERAELVTALGQLAGLLLPHACW